MATEQTLSVSLPAGATPAQHASAIMTVLSFLHGLLRIAESPAAIALMPAKLQMVATVVGVIDASLSDTASDPSTQQAVATAAETVVAAVAQPAQAMATVAALANTPATPVAEAPAPSVLLPPDVPPPPQPTSGVLRAGEIDELIAQRATDPAWQGQPLAWLRMQLGTVVDQPYTVRPDGVWVFTPGDGSSIELDLRNAAANNFPLS